MDEPPVVNNDSTDSSPNPFESPTTADTRRLPAGDLPPLTVNYWLTAIGILVVSVLALFVMSVAAVPALVGFVLALFRVPMMRWRLLTRGQGNFPSPPFMLFASWGFMTIAGYASLIAFAVVCIPSGAFFFTLHGPAETGMIWVMIISTLVGIGFYGFLYKISLKLPI
ncbi:MAG TPA: hypothetical protein DDW52_25385 [Planctomycetaceae bacterium]|nr:hypothetical protein [Planctomycetaceae bacterium]